jgi:hypothetical protein
VAIKQEPKVGKLQCVTTALPGLITVSNRKLEDKQQEHPAKNAAIDTVYFN